MLATELCTFFHKFRLYLGSHIEKSALINKLVCLNRYSMKMELKTCWLNPKKWIFVQKSLNFFETPITLQVAHEFLKIIVKLKIKLFA